MAKQSLPAIATQHPPLYCMMDWRAGSDSDEFVSGAARALRRSRARLQTEPLSRCLLGVRWEECALLFAGPPGARVGGVLPWWAELSHNALLQRAGLQPWLLPMETPQLQDKRTRKKQQTLAQTAKIL
jgi:hypothetical protein